MRKIHPLLSLIVLPLSAAEPLLTFENRPLGSPDAPLVLNSYLPDPGLDPAVFAHHHRGLPAPKYNPGKGEDVPGEDKPIAGIPSAIAVSFGPALAYAFDTTECRPLYAWQGGFLDMTPYWGDRQRGSRVSFDYVPRLVGNVFHMATGPHPVQIGGRNAADLGLEYTGYRLEKEIPTFGFKAGEYHLDLTLRPSGKPLSFEAELTCTPPAPLEWKEGTFSARGDGAVKFTHTGANLGTHQGYKVKIDLSKPNIKAGETLYNNYGCIGCHSTDGSKGHGPTLAGLAGGKREIEGSDEPVLADHAYLLEAIRDPNAKIAKGYPPNYMPPFGLPDAEYESLILFIQSIGKPE